jgi:citrate/tricarballylate utilization protein
MHDAPTEVMTDAYSEDEFYNDILRVTGGQTNEQLARMTIRASATCTEWMKRQGVRFQHAMSGTLHLGRTNAFFLGGGKAMMNAYFAAVGLFAALALLIGFLRFWRNVGEAYSGIAAPAALARAAKDVLRLENLDNGGAGCTYPGAESSQSLRWFHHLTFYGFLSCFVATTLGAIYYYGLGWHGPYGYTSWPVLFGTLGGIGLVIGPIGLFVLKQRSNREIEDESQYGMDVSFIVLLLLTSISGLLLLFLRDSAAMGTLLLVHLGIVMALFLTLPYGKFVHGIYRSAALLKWSLERSRPPEHNLEV